MKYFGLQATCDGFKPIDKYIYREKKDITEFWEGSTSVYRFSTFLM